MWSASIGHVSPSLPALKTIKRPYAQPCLLSDSARFLTISKSSPQNCSEFFSELRVPVLRASRGCHPISRFWGRRPISSLGHAIALVVSCGSQKQMGWVNAGRIVAAVADMKAVVDWAIGKFVSHAMRQLSDENRTTIVHIKGTVSTSANARQPWPAFVWPSSRKFRGESRRVVTGHTKGSGHTNKYIGCGSLAARGF